VSSKVPELTPESLATIEQYWAGDLGCRVEDLRGEQLVATRQTGPGIFIFARSGSVIAATPPSGLERVIGPAFIGYADAATFQGCDDAGARLLEDSDAQAMRDLRAACADEEWEHGGAAPRATAVGIFESGELAALASYQRWGDWIAHVSIVTHPQRRGRGLGRRAVSAITRLALRGGLVAQYRTLVENRPSLALAERLGFRRYALTLALRIRAA
jgi:GNAT superfamily N-acetyltransferase